MKIKVFCDSIDEQGLGVGSAKGTLFRIHGLLPGEEADVQVESWRTHQPEAYARVIHRYNDSPIRVSPACREYGNCPSCTLQHIAYEEQLRWKQQGVRAQLPDVADECWKPMAPAPNQGLHGRRTVKLVAVGQKQMRLGAYAPRSHHVVEMSGCQLATPLLSSLTLLLVQQCNRLGIKGYDEKLHEGQLRYVMLRQTLEGDAQISLICADPILEERLQELVRSLTEVQPTRSIMLFSNTSRGNAIWQREAERRCLYGSEFLVEKVGNISLRWSAESFMQANGTVAQEMYNYIAHAVSAVKEQIVDLYCGVGGIGLIMRSVHPHAELIGIEENPVAVEDARASIPEDEKSKTSFICGDVATEVQACIQKGQIKKGATVIVNPPRKGCSAELLQSIDSIAPDQLVYVSCNPASLALDLKKFSRYVVTEIKAFDMHPHTVHVEVVAILQKREDF